MLTAASLLDLVSGSCLAGFLRTSAAWVQLSARRSGKTQPGGAEGCEGIWGQWVGTQEAETTLALLVGFVVKGLGSKPRLAELEYQLSHRR